MKRLAFVLSLLVVAGCAAGELPYPPTLTVPLPDNEYGKFTLLVYDDTGLVVRGENTGGTAQGATPAEVTAQTDRNELVVNWTGSPCSHSPYLRVRGVAGDLKLVIAPAPVEISLTPAIQCPAVGIPSSVTLALSEPVDQASVEITEIR